MTSGRGTVPNAMPPRTKQYPWPFPGSAYQGAVGGGGGKGTVSVSLPPYYGPFNMYWPYFAPRLNGLPNPVLRS